MNSNNDLESSGRLLFYIPVVHTSADMGSLSEPIRRITVHKLGKKGWEDKIHWIDKLWTHIEKVVGNLDIDYEKVRLYQDGLPVCGREVELVNEMAKMKSRNYELLLHLMQKGAQIMGTESTDLLIQEYKRVKEVMSASATKEAVEITAQQKNSGDLLLKQRDKFIARRINSTLKSGETGILFLGMQHSLENHLDKDIRVSYPINSFFNDSNIKK